MLFVGRILFIKICGLMENDVFIPAGGLGDK